MSRDLGQRETCGTTARKNIAVLYTHFPHYRRSIFEALRRSQNYKFTFFYDVNGVDQTILSGTTGPRDVSIRSFRLGPMMFQPGFLTNALWGRFDAVILLGNPYIVTNWLFAFILRLRRRKVLMWTHGWLRENEGFKGQLRSLYYKMAHTLLLYGDHARRLGIKKGFHPNRMVPIYNSLDYLAQTQARAHITATTPPIRADGADGVEFLCVSRLIPDVRIDLAICALAILNRSAAQPARLVIIGEGPERPALEALALQEGVSVEFTGAVYDENVLAKRFLSAVAVVSPGKVGLLAMHALGYGTPVITHDDFDHQMPEVEAVIDGLTGAFFRRNNATSLAAAMASFMDRGRSGEIEAEAIRTIEARYTAEAQERRIVAALDEVLKEE